MQTAADAFGGLDILVNNASVMFMSDSIEELPDEQFERVFRVNVFGYFHTIKAAAKHLEKTGGCVINTGSIAGMMPFASGPDYAATKAAEHSLTWEFVQAAVEAGNPGELRGPRPGLDPAQRPSPPGEAAWRCMRRSPRWAARPSRRSWPRRMCI